MTTSVFAGPVVRSREFMRALPILARSRTTKLQKHYP